MLNRKKGAVGEVKFVFDIQVNSVTLKKPGQNLEKDCSVSVLIERGGKHHIATTEKEAKVGSTGDAVVIIAESLSLEATMYQEASGSYQEKVAKVTVRKRKRGIMQSHVPVGQTSLPLHSIIEEGNQPIDRTFLLEQCTFPGSQIQLVIRFRRLDGKPSLVTSDSQKLTTADSESNPNSHNHSTASETYAPAPTGKPVKPAGMVKPVPTVENLDTFPAQSGFTTTNDPFASGNFFAPSNPPDRHLPASSSQHNDVFESTVDGSAADFDPFSNPFGTTKKLSGNPSKHKDGFNNWSSSDHSQNAPPLPFNPPLISTPFEVDTESASTSSGPPPIPNTPPPVSSKRASQQSPGNPFAPSKPPAIPSKPPALPPHSEFDVSTHAPVVPVAPPVPIMASNTADVEALLAAKDEEIALVKSVLVIQEEKLSQAAQYVAYQDAQVAALTSELESLRAQLEEGQGEQSVSYDLSKVKDMEKVIMIQETKLEQAKGFIDHQQQEIMELQASLTSNEAQLADIQTKLLQAKEYIDYQTEQIAALEAQVADLPAPTATGENKETSEETVDQLKMQLQQAAEYVRYQESQLTDANEEIERLKDIMSTSHSDAVFEELRKALVKEEEEKEQVKTELKALQTKLKETLGYFEEAKAEIARFDREEEARNKTGVATEVLSATSDSTEKAAMEEKLQQAADYITFQEEQIADWESKYSTLQSEMMEVQAQLLTAQSEGSEREATSSSAVVSTAGSEETIKALAKAKDDIDTYRAQLQLLQADVEEKEHQLYEAQDEIAVLQQQLQSKSIPTTDASSVSGSIVNQESMEIEQRLQEMQEKVDQAKEFIAYQDEQIASKDEELIQLQDQVITLQSTMTTKAQELQQAQSQLKDLQEQLKIIEAQSQGFNKDLQQSILDLASAQEEIKLLKEALTVVPVASSVDPSLPLQLKEMQKKLDQAQEYIAYQDEAIATKGDENSELQQAISVSAQTMEALRNDLAEKETALQMAISEQNVLKEKVMDLEKELLAAKSHQFEEQNEQFTNLQMKIDEAKEFIAYQDEQLAGKDAEIARLNEELTIEKGQSSQLSASITKGMQEYQALAQAFEKSKSQLDERTDECNALTAQLSSLQQGGNIKEVELQQKIDQAKEYIAYQDESIAAKDEELSQLQSEIATLQKTLAEKEQTLKTSLDQQEDLKGSIKTLEEALSNQQNNQEASKDLQQKMDQAKEFIAFQEEQLAEKESEIARLTQELTVEKAQAVELNASLNKSTSELKQIQEQLQELRRKLTEQERELQKLRSAKNDSMQQETTQLQELQGKIDQAKEFITYQDEQLTNKDQDIAELQKQLFDKEQALEELRAKAIKNPSPVNGSTDTNGQSANNLTIQQQGEEIKNLKEKLDQAKEYIVFIEEQLDEHKATAALDRVNGEDVAAFQQILRTLATKLLSLLPEKSRCEMANTLDRMHAESLPAKDVGSLMMSLLDSVAGYYATNEDSTSPKSSASVGGDTAVYLNQLTEKEKQVTDVQERNRVLEEELKQLSVQLKNIAATKDSSAEDVHVYETTLQQLAEKLLTLLPEKTRKSLPPISSLDNVLAKERAQLMSTLLDSVMGYFAQQATTGGANASSAELERQLQELQERLQRESHENDRLIDEVIRVKMELAAANETAEYERHRSGMLTKRLHQAGLQV